MKIVIVGDGKVGYTLTKQLSQAGHDVVVIDSDQKVLQQSMEALDVFVVQGNGATLAVQQEVHDNRGHPLRPRHVAVGRDVDHPGQLIDDADISVVGIAHQVNRHAADQLGNAQACRLNLRVV